MNAILNLRTPPALVAVKQAAKTIKQLTVVVSGRRNGATASTTTTTSGHKVYPLPLSVHFLCDICVECHFHQPPSKQPKRGW
jgi:hypothetical protein